MISATFSCIKRYFPRIKIIHTSKKVMGQIYIHVMNWFLMVMHTVSNLILKEHTT
jgi:KUP system potassium uptake protein